MNVSSGPNDRRTAHRRAIAPAEEFDVARRQRRHDAIPRDELDGVEGSPIALDPGVVLSRTAVRIFKREMRDAGARAPAQVVDAWIMPMKPYVVRAATVNEWRLLRRR